MSLMNIIVGVGGGIDEAGQKEESMAIVVNYRGRNRLSTAVIRKTLEEYSQKPESKWAKNIKWQAGYMAALRDNRLINYQRWVNLISELREAAGL